MQAADKSWPLAQSELRAARCPVRALGYPSSGNNAGAGALLKANFCGRSTAGTEYQLYNSQGGALSKCVIGFYTLENRSMGYQRHRTVAIFYNNVTCPSRNAVAVMKQPLRWTDARTVPKTKLLMMALPKPATKAARHQYGAIVNDRVRSSLSNGC